MSTMPKITTIHTLYADSVRVLCRNSNWFTCGDDEQFSAMLKLCEQQGDCKPETLYTIALDIYNHSDDLSSRYGLGKTEMIQAIMAELNRECVFTGFYIEEE